ncbi:protein mono-ADP-ribosyltransferase PARP3-like [Phyllostomus hastatus]|uniref:protein mono-ADP-ribosyltransferase PARP3-like n=1 Tax=Phyllostomus hastatus TaxID=9423 RepID=UPI001E682961|nr:protein mono-ADP-ribosyltransferase PARP3-like [Phyllostomus hastatus]XP_045712649.1 protein mono-ADP-ribosyltransferase PARP3-like [Phyllostomus hastatus]XP_045712650.1 protein mono-ADP-ribosyltransferase PARP3-like [Phyllostomus hastatus]XP_045712651.1 protein mono-ADP-ribosyltransferase PARP3-like [Phyllostomus hastatus]
MAPKRKSAVQAEGPEMKKGRQGAEEDSFRSTAEALRAAPTEKRAVRVDPECPLSRSPGTQAQVHGDYDCTLNQTNIGSNNNKFYIIQLLEDGDRFFCWNRWGRVGEVGQSKLSPFDSLDNAKKDFEKKFRDKTKNSWAERDRFVAHPGKYTLIEVQGEDEAQEAVVKVDGGPVRTVAQRVRPCSLDAATQKLITNIFSKDMFTDAMTLMNLDVKKMPLGKLSKQQIARGFEALEAVEAALRAPTAGDPSLEELSSRFYTVIPHNFGRSRPPPINSLELLQAKKDMLLVLADIELARSLQTVPEEEERVQEVPHPVDRDYQLLRCQLELLDPEEPEYKVIHTYLTQTGTSYRCPALQHVWKVNREGEEDRFQAHCKLGNRRLLWHGTNVAVVAAILTSGLRIMPHSGGRVGKGIYFASENSKSAGYVTGMSCGDHRIGYMFLGEVALGREHHVTTDQPSLKKPPPGFDSVIARGHTEPDPSQDTELELDGQRVAVPQGQPTPCPEFTCSSFSQSEYLIYQESQCRLRYLLELRL